MSVGNNFLSNLKLCCHGVLTVLRVLVVEYIAFAIDFVNIKVVIQGGWVKIKLLSK